MHQENFQNTKIKKNLEYRLQNWKEKAVERNKEIRSLKKEIKEKIKSRDLNWEKWRKERQINLVLKAEIKKLESKLDKKSEAVKGHSYALETISLCLQIKQSGTMSLRTCRAVLLSLFLYFEIEMEVPCAETIRIWALKYGYYNLEEQEVDGGKYVIIIDESFNVGRQSMLLILGVKLSTYEFKSSLNMEDMKVLSMEVKKSWTAADISKQIKHLKDLGYQIAYGCTDGGRNIVKSLIDSNINRIYDCTHALGLLVKKNYEEEEQFKSFLTKYALLNRQNYMGQDTYICPPKLKGKCRFLNIYPIADWAEKHLKLIKKLSNKKRSIDKERIYQKLIWLEDFSDLIGELVQLSKLLKSTFELLKTAGLSEKSIKEVKQLVTQSTAPLFMRQGIRTWLEENKGLLSEYEQLICCSDIIESFFGKFKHEQIKNPNKGITIGSLNLVNYGKEIDKKEIKKAMEEVRIVDLKDWAEKRNLKSFSNKRKNLFGKVG